MLSVENYAEILKQRDNLIMDRATWLKEMRQACEADYDSRWAPLYAEKWGLYENAVHLQFLQEFLSHFPRPAAMLDAACGAGRYLPYLLEKQHAVLGIDQSQGMLAKAREKFPQARLEKIGLQEMSFQEAFDGAICMDSMENVPPEDWPPVLGNFHRALKPGGYFYFTVENLENADEKEVRESFERAQATGFPVIYGECPDEQVYHYHPTRDQIKEWVRGAGFELLKEGDGDIEYYHLMVRKP